MVTPDSHEGVVDAHDKHLTGVGDLRMVDVAGHVLLGAGAGEGGGDADDDALVHAGAELLGQVHLVGRRLLLQLDVRDGVADLDEDAG